MTSTVDRVAEIKCTDSRARQGGGRGGGVAGVGGADPDGAWFAARGGRQLGRPSRDQSEPMDPVRNRERRRHCASAAYQGGRSPLPSSVPLVFFFPRRLSLRHFFFSIVFLVFSIFIIRSILIIIIVFFDVLAFTGLNWVILGFLFQCFAFIFFQLFSWFHFIYAAADDGIVVVVVAAVVFVVVAVALVVVVVVVFAAPMPLSIFVIGKITFHISRISCRGYPTQLFF